MIRILMIFCITATLCFSQQVTIKDKITFQPLEFVSIFDAEKNISALTGINGKAEITRFSESEKITFRLLGYETIEISFSRLKEINFILLMEQTPVTLSQIVVSANKWEQDKSDIPVKIEAIGPQTIAFQNPQTAADMLALSGSVYIQKSQLGGGSPIIRGFSTNRVLIVVDGVRMNSAIYRSGNVQNVISLDANSLGGTEVIFGPGSVIYGSDAIGGVMNFLTLNPKISGGGQTLFSTQAFGRYSSANKENTGHLHFGFSSGKWGLVTGLTYSKFGDLTTGSNGPSEFLRPTYQNRINGVDTVIVNIDSKVQKESGYDQLNFMQKIRFKPNSMWDFQYAFHYSTSSDVPRYDRLIQPQGTGLRSAQWYYGPQKWMMNQFSITNVSSNSFYDISKFIVAYQNTEESRHDRRFNNNILNHRTEKVNLFSLNIDMLKNINNESNIFYGVEAVFNKIFSTGESENIVNGNKAAISNRYPDGSTWNSFGAYAVYKRNFGNTFVLQSGLRFTTVAVKADFVTTFFPFPFSTAELNASSVNGSIGGVWKAADDLQFNINLSTGFRAPNIDDIGRVFDSTPGRVVVPNPDLKPEYAYNGEIGLTKLFSNKAKFDIVGYYTILENALVRRMFKLNGQDSIVYDGVLSGVEAIQNAANAKVYGVEFGTEILILKGLQFGAKINFQKGEEEDGAGNKEPLRHAAPIFGNIKLTYSMERLKAELYGLFNGEISNENLTASEQAEPFIYAKDSNGKPYVPSWFTVNLKLSYSLTDYLILYGGVENITDKLYRPYSSGISAPGRNFIFSARVNY